jgi:hypothetical protein
LEMDQHKKRGLRRWAEHVRQVRRRDRFLTLLGSVIIFVTFIVKEGISESLKDLVSSIDTAENFFVLREDIAFRSSKRPLPTTSPDTGPTPDQMKEYIEIWDTDSQGLLPICLDLAKSLPDEGKFKARADKISGELWQTGNGIVNVKALSKTQKQLYDATKGFYDRSLKNYAAANMLRVDVLKEANDLKEKREAYYKRAKWASYILFAIGWLLAFYGQLSGKGETPPRGNA